MTTSVLRFITAGSVDDGKSTLIGRLLYDSKTLLTDQLHQLDKAVQNGQQPDFASLTDGLAAEREQGITIDVAYRYFSTPKRKFIIADTPGHEQYTRNMVTGASTAHAAIVLIDATRVGFSETATELLPQTKRHSAILKLLGTPSVIVAVNKLDLVDFDQTIYQKIVQAYQDLAKQIGLNAAIYFVPISALSGDNIVYASSRTPWYEGKPLLPLLETLPSQSHDLSRLPAHFPVQRVARQDGSSHDDFRGYQGRLVSGSLKIGQSVKVLPSGQMANITQIYTPQGLHNTAQAGEVLTLVLDKDLDISRGDALVSADNPMVPTQTIQAALCWFDDVPLNVSRRYLLKHSTQTVAVKIRQIQSVWDVHTLSRTHFADSLKINDIGRVTLATQQPINATTYAHHAATGAFILIDEATNHTVAAGMISSNDSHDEFEI